MSKKNIIIFSPHIDDAFLSMGGTIHFFAEQQKKIKIINIFSDTQFTNISLINDVVKTRIQEENLNLDIIYKLTGNRIETHFLDLPDALQRGYSLKSSMDFPKITDEFNNKNICIKNFLKNFLTEDALIYIPLGLGNHIDHIIVRNTILYLSIRKKLHKNIMFFEEQPYATFMNTKPNFLEDSYIEIDFDTKKQLIESYKSQLIEIEELLKNMYIYSNFKDYINSPKKSYERFFKFKKN